jgi:hypothetical protein
VQEGNDDCGKYYVSKDDLENLVGVVAEALERKDKATRKTAGRVL